MNQLGLNVANPIIQAIIQFKADLLWDDIVGVFEHIPYSVVQVLEEQYSNALTASSEKLEIDLELLKGFIEEEAYKKIDGLSFSEEEVKKRLQEYGVI